MGGASIPYLLGAEIPNAALREKTQALGTSWNVLWAFATNYSIPYMIASINFQVGWVFGSIAVLALVFTIFFLPETKVNGLPAPYFLQIPHTDAVFQGRALEEIDAIFEHPFNPFRPSKIDSVQARSRIGQIEREKDVPASVLESGGTKNTWVEARDV